MVEPLAADPALETQLQAATDHHVAGRLAEAMAGYRQVLDQAPGHLVALHRLGVLTLQQGDALAAEALFRRVVGLDPAAWRSHCSRGQALAALGRGEEAMEAFRRTLELHEESFEAAMGLARVCESSGRLEEALEAYGRAAALRPGDGDARANLGDALHALGRHQEAVAAYHQALALAPGHAEAQNNLGLALQDLGRLPEAVEAFRAALALRDDFPQAHANLGNALLLDRRADQALDVLQRAVRRWPGAAGLHHNLGNAAFARRAFPEAAEAFRQALALDPGHLAAHNNLGNTLQAMGRFDEALDVYARALALRPDFVDTYSNASAAARTLGRMDEALAFLNKALALKPAFQPAYCNLGNVLKDVGKVDEALSCFRAALALDPKDAVTHSNLVYTMGFHPDCDAASILKEAREWARCHAAPLGGPVAHANCPDPDRPLRLGYVSPNFKEHVLAYFLVPLLANHDRDAFKVHAYSLARRPDATTRRLAALAAEWHDVADLDDAELAAKVREDGIDILVDLTMHMAHGRPLMFARKPAPVQVAWLAYPGTTGLSAMDYRLTDPNLDPPGTDGFYAEASVRLPDVFSCYDPLVAEPRPGPLPALANGYMTFGCFNNFSKVNPQVEALWCDVMAAVPGSRLLLLAQPGAHRQRLLKRMEAGGVDPGRVEFVGFQPRHDYLALHRRVDLCLDTFPYNGHTTSLDALWMGVPVVTRVGRTVVGRTCLTLLANLGLQGLAAATDDDYVKIVAGLARDLPALAQLREGLRARLEASPLMDGRRFARNLEAAFREMWTAWCTKRLQ